jgi:hypothetical protein
MYCDSSCGLNPYTGLTSYTRTISSGSALAVPDPVAGGGPLAMLCAAGLAWTTSRRRAS